MIIKDEKVGEYCDGGLADAGVAHIQCPYPHRSGGCVKHPDTIVLDCVCVDCYKEKKI